jgi:GLPGLI family protein
MKNIPIVTLLSALHLLSAPSLQAQKKVSELTLVYSYTVVTTGSDGDKKNGDMPGAAAHTVYIKGSKSRSEMTDSLFSSVTLFDASTGSGVILKEVSGQKLLIRLNAANWLETNKPYEGIVYKNTTDTKEIAGYRCIKAQGTTLSGTVITVYYTREIIPDNKEYAPEFRSLEGLPLEYTLTKGNVEIRYKVARMNFNPVPASKFDIPASGYRELKYDEVGKTNTGGK